MIRPVRFAFNEQTAGSNAFQDPAALQAAEDVQGKALAEFDALVDSLRSHGVDVTVVSDTPEPHTPDAIFPNNWVSFHDNGTVCLYPMFAPNRRLERRPEVIEGLKRRFLVDMVLDFSDHEQSGRFLEGTGSMVLDRDHRIAYACISPRTDAQLLKEFSKTMSFRVVSFTATGDNGQPVYHTNVVMALGTTFAVICLESIPDQKERYHVQKTLEETGKDVVEISLDQMNRFAGNMLQLKTRSDESLLVMSTQAYRSLLPDQIRRLERHTQLIYSDLYTIERNGGGSARCMIAEVHLPGA
jgi:hypothetical protein